MEKLIKTRIEILVTVYKKDITQDFNTLFYIIKIFQGSNYINT